MRSPGLVVMGVAGLLVVGYAFYTLLAPPPPRPGTAAGRSRGEASRGADDPAGEAGDEGERKARSRTPSPKPAVSTNRPQSPPAPRPEPSLPIDEARQQFADYIAELDALVARGAKVTSPEWVELYKKGHEKLAPLQQNLDWQLPDDAAELRKANEDMRSKLAAIDPNRPPSPPS